MKFHFLHLKGVPIFSQLQLEEAYLRQDRRNIVILNEGTPPAIVMGISGKAEELINKEKTKEASIPIIRRFSGGGTVVVDEETIFVTFICQKEAFSFPPYPEQILSWTEDFYKAPFPFLSARENDYVIGNKKCGGNAQYIRKDRWLHHTSFLWNFSEKSMDLLLHPKKTPVYREGRKHTDFLTPLSSHLPSKEVFVQKFIAQLEQVGSVEQLSPSAALTQDLSHGTHRKITAFHSW